MSNLDQHPGILKALTDNGVLDEFLNWRANTPDWREQILAHNMYERKGTMSDMLAGTMRVIRNHVTFNVLDWPSAPLKDRDSVGGKVPITCAEWKAKHRDFKTGRATKNPDKSTGMMMGLSSNGGTCLWPVFIAAEGIER